MTSASDVEAKSCDFCAIARGEDRSVEVVCEEESWIAFFPLDPATPGHTLVIPRKHVVDLWEAEPPLGAELMAAVIRVGRAIDVSLKLEGMNLITSAGKVAEQTVLHLHCARQVFETVRCVFLLCRCQVVAVVVSGERGGRLPTNPVDFTHGLGLA